MKELAAETPWQIIRPCVYVPNAQVPDALKALKVRITPIAWVVRTRGEPRALSAAVQEQLRQVSGLAVAGVRTMDEVISRSTSSG